MAASLEQILQSREDRVARQRQLLARYPMPMICFTMNMPGPDKAPPALRRAFFRGLQSLDASLDGHSVCHRQVVVADTGCEAYLCVELPAEQLKLLCMELEDSHPLGRLFDLDVFLPSGEKLQRTALGRAPRRCMVCGLPGRGCASRRVHPLPQLLAAVDAIIGKDLSGQLGALAVRSLAREARTTPKPGLVDEQNSGSHPDMTLSLFLASAQTLEPYFCQCVQIGLQTAALPPEETFRQLRQPGIAALETMYHTTGGINTHKGAIYVLGLLCAGAGRCFPRQTPESLLRECAAMTAPTLDAELAAAGDSHGGRLYRTLGIRGVRGEAAAGFPSVEKALAFYENALRQGHSPNDSGVMTLLKLMTLTQDTVLWHRGGHEGATYATQTAQLLLDHFSKETLEDFDREMIRRNLSPGGAADLLAAVYFLSSLQKERYDHG